MVYYFSMFDEDDKIFLKKLMNVDQTTANKYMLRKLQTKRTSFYIW